MTFTSASVIWPLTDHQSATSWCR